MRVPTLLDGIEAEAAALVAAPGSLDDLCILCSEAVRRRIADHPAIFVVATVCASPTEEELEATDLEGLSARAEGLMQAILELGSIR